MSKKTEVVGTFTIAEPREDTQHFETALWHRTGRFDPQTVELRLLYGNYFWPDRLLTEVEGVVTSACFLSRLGGSYGGDRGPEEVGNTMRYTISLRPNVGDSNCVDLLPEYEWLRDEDSWASICCTRYCQKRISQDHRFSEYDARHVNLDWIRKNVSEELWELVRPLEAVR